MPVITPYAEVVGQEKVSRELVGIPDFDGRLPTGRPLGEFRAQATSGTFLYPLSESVKEDLQLLYDLNQDVSCLELKNRGYILVSLEHLSDLDDETKVHVGYRISYSREESRLLPGDPEHPRNRKDH
jgi:hypothetical protein